MRFEAGFLAVVSVLVMAGCVSHAKPPASASAPPAPLSVPQTQVALPPEQPLDPGALPTSKPPAQRAEAPAPRPAQRSPAPAAVQPAAQPVQPAEQRPAVQAIVSAEEQKRLKDSADASKRQVRAVLAQVTRRRLSAGDQDLVKRVQFFLAQSDQAEQRGDMGQADAFAQRAQELARGWQGAR